MIKVKYAYLYRPHMLIYFDPKKPPDSDLNPLLDYQLLFKPDSQ